ncbi:hypothetical protein [Dactylosporangium sp. CA-139066]|uniref:hypothetical protein n=1 Tax=Dactylosporangium sp. CA-139066 TaxID=3239930 RepID=UPI003D8F195A
MTNATNAAPLYTPAAGDADQYNELGEPSSDAGPGAAPNSDRNTCAHGFWVQGGIQTCPNGCPQTPIVDR